MKTYFIVQDLRTGEYFFEYRIDSGFTDDIEDASEFTDRERIFDYLNRAGMYDDELFTNRVLQIIELIKT